MILLGLLSGSFVAVGGTGTISLGAFIPLGIISSIFFLAYVVRRMKEQKQKSIEEMPD